MEAGQQTQRAIFAANGAARHRLVRAAIVAGFALLAAWAVALALGVMGGFGSLPMLPSGHPHDSSSAGARPESPRATAPAPAVRVHAQRTAAVGHRQASSGGRSVTSRPRSTPARPAAPKVTGSPSSAGSNASALHGHAQGSSAPTTTGKPVGSPGNGPGGTGAPGQLR